MRLLCTQSIRAVGLQIIAAALFCVAMVFAPGATAGADEGPSTSTQSIESNSNRLNLNQMPDNSVLNTTDIADLAKADTYQNGQMVQVQGEVVGDCITDEASPLLCWITLQSLKEGNYSVVAVVMSREQTSMIDGYGNYRTNGTQLLVRGTFYQNCAEHQGLSDLHAKEVTLIKKSSERITEVNSGITWAAFLSLGVGALFAALFLWLRERTR